MRVLQLIDSLDAGGAERVAVNIANMLSNHIEHSYICATRKEGLLKNTIKENVNYLFLGKKSAIDFKAITKLSKYIKQEKITIIHAHSSSFFLATLIKIRNRNLKLVWHDHYGKSEFLKERKSSVLSFCSRYFDYTFSVNKQLEHWAKTVLKQKKVTYLPNFAIKNDVKPETELLGIPHKRIVHLANLRPQKDHIILFKAFAEIIKTYSDWTLHCVGKDFNDDYTELVKTTIKKLKLENNVFLYGSKSDISHILSQVDIGVLSSKSEGLPIALLEYGLSKLAVVSTNVGECSNVIQHNVNGVLVSANEAADLKKGLLLLIKDEVLRRKYALAFNKHINSNYSSEVLIKEILNKYNKIHN